MAGPHSRQQENDREQPRHKFHVEPQFNPVETDLTDCDAFLGDA
jgi:hypothetical protein